MPRYNVLQNSFCDTSRGRLNPSLY